MVTSWLAVAEPTTAWAHHPWTDFAARSRPDHAVAILPVHALTPRNGDHAFDLEETAGSVLLRTAVLGMATRHTLRVLPPLRFVPSAGPGSLFAIDFDAACELAQEIAAGVQAAGLQKLVFLHTNPLEEPYAATAALDIRARTGLRTYIVDASALGFSPVPDGADALKAPAGRLTGILEEICRHAASVPDDPDATPRPSGAEPGLHPSFRNRYLAALTPARLAALPAAARALAILPVGAIEQHGPHLPVGVDAILGQALLHAALARLPDDAPVWVTPAVTYGKSNEHTGFPGTIAITARSLRHLVLTVARQMRDLGFHRLAIFNTHGGNRAALAAAAREVRERFDMDADLLRHEFTPDLSAQEKAWGLHAGEWETSLMLACAPDLVHPERAVTEYPAHLDDPGTLRPERSAATYAWLTRDLSRSGVLGDPIRATAENGRKWLAGAASRLAEVIDRRCTFHPPGKSAN